MDVDIQKEYARQRDHLERSVASFRKKLTKDQQIHRADNVRIMQVCAIVYIVVYGFNFFVIILIILLKRSNLFIIRSIRISNFIK